MRTYFVLILTYFTLHAQLMAQQKPAADSLPRLQTSGEWRNYFLYELNEGAPKDFYALTTGGHLKASLRAGKRWEVAAAFYSAQLIGGNFDTPDPLTGKGSRYAIGLLDVNNPGNRHISDIGEAYVRFHAKQWQAAYGRMRIKTPFFNPQDGRMIPTLAQGAHLQWKNQQWLLEGYGIQAVWVRNTDGWRSIEESIGLYPSGRAADGTPHAYAGNIDSDYLFIVHGGLHGKSIRQDFYAYAADRLFTLYYAEGSARLHPQWTVAWQGHYQNKWQGDANTATDWYYFPAQGYNYSLGAKVSYTPAAKHHLGISYLYLNGNAPFTFPREWGRDPFFTFQRRERSEGLAFTQAVVLEHRTHWGKHWQLRTDWGWHQTPAPGNYASNRYGLATYQHFNTELSYRHAHWNLSALITYKTPLTQKLNDAQRFGKLNLALFHLLVSYKL
ncbi:OprD family outer membrane porin [Thermonema rossianum]|uniref:OprD family outer membrane porin n=1 Tax=Thermonema rossianum TaxID=55505 RepID=UPI000570E9FC|nr:OprD family outer membrane porin [Thermonema rossianum]